MISEIFVESGGFLLGEPGINENFSRLFGVGEGEDIGDLILVAIALVELLNGAGGAQN